MHKLATVRCKYEKKGRCKVQQDNFKTGQSTFITPVKSIWNSSFWNFSFFHFIQWFSPSRHTVIFLEFLLCEKEQQVVSSRDSIRVHSFATIHHTVYVWPLHLLIVYYYYLLLLLSSLKAIKIPTNSET